MGHRCALPHCEPAAVVDQKEIPRWSQQIRPAHRICRGTRRNHRRRRRRCCHAYCLDLRVSTVTIWLQRSATYFVGRRESSERESLREEQEMDETRGVRARASIDTHFFLPRPPVPRPPRPAGEPPPNLSSCRKNPPAVGTWAGSRRFAAERGCLPSERECIVR